LGFYKRDDPRIAKDNKHAAEIAINAGSDMDMESSAYVDHLVALVKEGKVKRV
jgi:beta-glucosidase